MLSRIATALKLAVVALAAIAFYGCSKPAEQPLEPLTFSSLGVNVDSIGIDRLVAGLAALPPRVVDPDDDFAPLELYLTAAIADPEGVDEAFRKVQYRLDSRSTAGGLCWPVTASPVEWALPLRDAALMTGSEQTARNGRRALAPLLRRDIAVQLDTALTLFRGASPALDTDPEVGVARLADMRSFAANASRLAALRFVAGEYGTARFLPLADSLALAMTTLLWDPEHNRFNAALYGPESPVAGGVAPSVAESAAVIARLLPPEAARRLVASTPAPVGAPLALAYRAVAACRVGNEQAFVAAFALLLAAFPLTDSNAAADRLLGVMLRGVFGISPAPDALEIAPFVPSEFPDELHLKGLRYRDAVLDITLNGHGDVVSTFTIDGTVCDTPSVPADLKGRHEVKVTLVGFSDPDARAARFDAHPAPAVPEVYVDGGEVCAPALEPGAALSVYVDGELLMQTADSVFEFARSASGTVAFTLTDPDGLTSAPTAPLYIYPDRRTISISVDKIKRPGPTNLLRDRRIDPKVARSFVESSRFRHPDLQFDVTPARPGRYHLQVEYLDGLGIVNPERRFAVRSLANGDTDCGLVVFGQLSPENWSHQVKWWERRGLTQPLAVDLRPGTNHLALRYFFAPGLTDDANSILPVAIHLTPAP